MMEYCMTAATIVVAIATVVMAIATAVIAWATWTNSQVVEAMQKSQDDHDQKVRDLYEGLAVTLMIAMIHSFTGRATQIEEDRLWNRYVQEFRRRYKGKTPIFSEVVSTDD